MFEWLLKFSKILVTGPQRAGTRICAQAIAYDTSYEYIDEEDLQMDSLYSLFAVNMMKEKFVAQCPTFCRYIHFFSADDTAIILMKRNIQDIISSQKRINWGYEKLELARYDQTEGDIAEIKYKYWRETQKNKITNAFEIDYESLSVHPLWINEQERRSFRPNQTRNQLMQRTIDPDLCFYPAYSVQNYSGFDQFSLLVVKQGKAKVLNDTGRMIWELCDGTHTRQDIYEALQNQYQYVNVDELSDHLDQFLYEMVQSDWLRFSKPIKKR